MTGQAAAHQLQAEPSPRVASGTLGDSDGSEVRNKYRGRKGKRRSRAQGIDVKFEEGKKGPREKNFESKL